jgi:hypothetical protein
VTPNPVDDCIAGVYLGLVVFLSFFSSSFEVGAAPVLSATGTTAAFFVA